MDAFLSMERLEMWHGKYHIRCLQLTLLLVKELVRQGASQVQYATFA